MIEDEVEVDQDGIDEHSWVDDLMADAVEDPITVADEIDAPSESEDDR